jgi:K+-sensing histidine kinase KdpD
MFEIQINHKSRFVNFKLKEFTYDGRECKMVIVQDRTFNVNFDKLQRNNEMMQIQASCVSHDMRAPLGAITHVIDYILNKQGMSRKVIKLLKPVRCASKILNMQVFNLLDYNLLQKDNFRVNP